MSLEITGLSKNYGAQKALDHINLSIGKDEIIGLLGPNGAGKSTLMKCIAGAALPDTGTIFFKGKYLVDGGIGSKKNIGFLAENNPLYDEMYVQEYLLFVAAMHGVPADRVAHVIDMVGLTPEKKKKLSQLSKGFRQRAGLAQAILHEPDLLILDEPTNGLDPNQIIEIRNVVREIGSGKTVILSTHLMQEVEALCSRVVLLHRGKILKDSPIEEFRDRFRNLEDAFAHYTS